MSFLKTFEMSESTKLRRGVYGTSNLNEQEDLIPIFEVLSQLSDVIKGKKSFTNSFYPNIFHKLQLLCKKYNKYILNVNLNCFIFPQKMQVFLLVVIHIAAQSNHIFT